MLENARYICERNYKIITIIEENSRNLVKRLKIRHKHIRKRELNFRMVANTQHIFERHSKSNRFA